MKLNESTLEIFAKVLERLKPYQSLIQNNKAIIAYSGGKDSTLLAYFYKYMFENGKCPNPILYHLDHSIRDNFLQEKEIEMEMKYFSSEAIFKKKTFQKYLNA